MGLLRRCLRVSFRFIGSALVIVAMSCAILLICQTVFNPFQVVKGNSMSPQIKSGDALVVKDLKENEIQAGKMVVFPDPEVKGQFIVHRIVSLEKTSSITLLTTKGDNNPVNDPEKVASGLVVRGVATRVPRLGLFLNALSSPKGYLGFIAIPGLLALLLAFGQSIVETVSRRRRRSYETPVPVPAATLTPAQELVVLSAKREAYFPVPTAAVEQAFSAGGIRATGAEAFYVVPTAMP